MKGREHVGAFTPETLIADTTFPLDVVSVTLASTDEVEVLERGTVLSIDTATETCKGIRTVSDTTSYAAYVLADKVETSTTEKIVAQAYQTGKFVHQSLKTVNGYELSQGDLKALRDGGIYVESAMM